MREKIEILKTKRIAIITLIIALVLSLFVLYTPRIVATSDTTTFSGVRAANHIGEISKKPHSYYDQVELEEVRVYLEDTLTDYLGALNVERITYDKETMSDVLGSEADNLDYPLVNILAKIPGQNEEGIVIMAHYDSRGHIGRYGELGRSYGAMDDGYGIGTMLELAYLLKDTNPTNTIYFLFTDAEEIGLYGAKMAVSDEVFLNNVKFLINLEARGRYGPSYMFETSKNNDKVIDLYKHASFPVTYSMATAVYSVMPNYTDFTPFIDKGIVGMNFANLAGLQNYHTPLDTYELISIETIQHMGSQIEPIIREFASDSKYIEDNYFEAESDQVFFTLFANVFINYSNTAAIILMILIVIAFGLVIFIKVRSNELNLNILKKSLPKALLVTGIVLIAAYVYSNIVAFIGRVPFSLFYVRVSFADPLAVIFILLTVLALTLTINKNSDDVLLIGLGINVLLTVVTTLILPGASFLFLVISISGIITILSKYVNNYYLKHSLLFLAYTLVLLLVVPILFSFYMALTIGGLLVLSLLLILAASIFIPAIIEQFRLENVSE